MNIWQPIETAPRDGTPLLLWWDSKPVISYYAERVGFKGWQPPSMMPIKVGDRSAWNPTHWMPLPSAPSDPAQEPEAVANPLVTLTYTNYRGETSERTIAPKSLRFGSTEWHPEPQWLLLAYDTDKRADREFALKDFGTRPVLLDREAVARIIDPDAFAAWDMAEGNWRKDEAKVHCWPAEEKADAILALTVGRA